MTHGHACFLCGSSASFGFRLPGLLSELPEGKRGVLWACRDHRGEAERRREAAAGLPARDPDRRSEARSPGPQGDLFGAS